MILATGIDRKTYMHIKNELASGCAVHILAMVGFDIMVIVQFFSVKFEKSAAMQDGIQCKCISKY